MNQEGNPFRIDQVNRTVSWEERTVRCQTGYDQEPDWVELTYPDGSTFRRFRFVRLMDLRV